MQGSNLDALVDRSLGKLARRSAALPVTCVTGTADRIRRFFAHAKRVTARDRVTDIWPHLSAVLYARGAEEVDRGALASEVGDAGVTILEMCLQPEGAVAVEDPRHGALRLLPDHGCYFEFVPVDQLGKSRPPRLGVADVRTGVPYALAVSSPAGVWACLVGSVVQFERQNPHLLRMVEQRSIWSQLAPAAPPRLATLPFPAPTRPGHPRTGGTAVGLRGTFSRTAWSGRVGRE